MPWSSHFGAVRAVPPLGLCTVDKPLEQTSSKQINKELQEIHEHGEVPDVAKKHKNHHKKHHKKRHAVKFVTETSSDKINNLSSSPQSARSIANSLVPSPISGKR